MRRLSDIAGLLLGAFALLAQSVSAEPAYSRIELLSASTMLGNGQPVLLGVSIQPQPGWKTYWRAPGESGLPPAFLFKVHENTALPQIKWPAPKRLTLQGLESYGYDGPVIFPFYMAPKDAAKPARIELQVDYAVCKDVCVPEQAVLSLEIPPGAATASRDHARLLASLQQVPRASDDAGAHRILTSHIARTNGKVELYVAAYAKAGFKAPDLFVDGAPDLMFSAPRITYSLEQHRAMFSLGVTSLNPAQPILGQTVTLTLVDREFALEKQVKLAERARTE